MVKQDLRRFAPWGLYLSGIALVAAGALYILEGYKFSLPVQIALVVIVLGLALFVFLDPQRALHAITGRQARYGSNSLILVLAFTGIVILVNYLVNQTNWRWDLTEDQQNTLAPETVKTLDSLKNAVKAEAFFTSQNPIDTTTRKLLDNYKLNGKGKFTYQVIDPNNDPVSAQQAKITRDGTIVLEAEGRMEQVTTVSEQAMTSALVRLENPGERAIYFLTGHGEKDINGTDQKGYSQIKTMLSAKNYTINTLDLLSKPQVPSGAKAIIVAGPTKPLTDAEVTALKAYVDKGGSLIYLSDPVPATQFGTQPDPLANYLQKSWGIKVGADVVIDLDNQQQPLAAYGSQMGTHTITTGMSTTGIGLPVARSVSAGTPPSTDITLTVLVSTSANAWGETDYASLQSQRVTPDKAKDLMGPVPLAVAGSNAKSNSRVVVIGNSMFASDYNNYFSALGNADFFLNSVDWAAQQESMINLNPKQATQRLLVMPQAFTLGLILIGSVFLLPGLVILTGITTWVQRRRRG